MKKVLFFGFLSIFLFSSLPSQEISDYERRLKNIAEQIEALRAKIQEEEKKASTLLSRLERIGIQKSLLRKEIIFYEVQMEKANKELEAIQKNIPRMREKLNREREGMANILVSMYKFGQLSYLSFLLHIRDLKDLITENKHLLLLAQSQNQVVQDYLNTLRSLEEAEKKLEIKKQEVAGLLQSAQQKRKELEEQEIKNKALIAEIAQNKSNHLKAVAELRERSRQLQDLISRLGQKQVSFPVLVIPLYEKKGTLPWPLEGEVVTYFGLQRHPRFQTVTMNNGIEIASRENMIIRSIHPGVVVYCDHFEGYGNTIIIDHGLTYYSLYGHCSDFLVTKGDGVQDGRPIAVVGDTGSLKGTTLYFGIYYRNKPLNPLQWLNRR